MSGVRDPMEKLARDICWAGFSAPEHVGVTKAAYWKSLPQITRDDYLKEAKHFAFLLPRMNIDVLNEIEGMYHASFNIVGDEALDGG